MTFRKLTWKISIGIFHGRPGESNKLLRNVDRQVRGEIRSKSPEDGPENRRLSDSRYFYLSQTFSETVAKQQKNNKKISVVCTKNHLQIPSSSLIFCRFLFQLLQQDQSFSMSNDSLKLKKSNNDVRSLLSTKSVLQPESLAGGPRASRSTARWLKTLLPVDLEQNPR